MATDLEIAYQALSTKLSSYNTLWDYYNGNQPLKYSTQRLREAFRMLDVSFTENWCAAVVDACLERLELQRFTVADDENATAAINALFGMTGLDLDAMDAHLCALVTGESFIFAWREEGQDPSAYYNDSRLAYAHYDPANPRTMLWAAKWWMDNGYYLTLYYPDRLEYYRSTSKDMPTSAGSFKPLDAPQAPNPWGEIPVFHLRRRRTLLSSELQNILTLQDAINKLLADMMVAAEFGAFRQRWIISNAETNSLRNAPNEIWSIPAGDGVGQATTVGEFPPGDLSNFLNAIDRLAQAIGTISRTPAHYLFGSGAAPSGEALIVMEAPLNKKVSRYIANLTPTWAACASFLARLAGYEIPAAQISVEFAEPATVQPRTEAEIRQMTVGAGVPLTTALRWEGKSDADLEQLQADKAAEAAASMSGLAQALVEQQRRFDQEGNAAMVGEVGNE